MQALIKGRTKRGCHVTKELHNMGMQRCSRCFHHSSWCEGLHLRDRWYFMADAPLNVLL